MSIGMEQLDFALLENGLPGITPIRGSLLVEGIIVAMLDQNHVSGKEIEVQGITSSKYVVCWTRTLDRQLDASWNDRDDSTEFGACGIAILLILKLTDYTVIKSARKGDGVDYWLGNKNDQLFQEAARLEVSGIRNNDMSHIKGRVKQKKKQSKKSDGQYPAYIAVVEFSRPLAVVEER